MTVTVDSRTGRLNLRSIGDLATAGRGPRFLKISERLNEDPNLLSALTNLRILVNIIVLPTRIDFFLKKNTHFQTIIDSAEQKAKYLGLQSYRRRNFQPGGEFDIHSTDICSTFWQKSTSLGGHVGLCLFNWPTFPTTTSFSLSETGASTMR